MKRAEAQRAYYEQGRITIDRYLDALEQVRIARTLVATNRQERIKAALQHRDLVAAVLKHELAEQETGRSTTADVAEAQLRNDYADLEVLRGPAGRPVHHGRSPQGPCGGAEQKLDQIHSTAEPASPGLEAAPTGLRR